MQLRLSVGVGAVFRSADLQSGIAQRRRREELGEIADTLGLAFPFFRIDHDDRSFAIPSDGLWTVLLSVLDDLAELRLCFRHGPEIICFHDLLHRAG